MILVAAMAAGFALARLCWPQSTHFSGHALREWASATLGATSLPCTVAFLVIRLTPPRPRRQRLMCQPGIAACCAGTVAIVAGLCRPVLSLLHSQYFATDQVARPFRFYHNFFYIYGLPIGPAVVATWIALALSGRWRPEARVDRCPRADYRLAMDRVHVRAVGIWPLECRACSARIELDEVKVNRSNPTHQFRFIDGISLAAAFAVAIAIARIDPGTLEEWLGLPPSMAGVRAGWPFASRAGAVEKADSWIESANLYCKLGCKALLRFGTPIVVLSAPGLALATFRGRSMRRRNLRGVGVLTTLISGVMVTIYLVNEYLLRRLSEYFKDYGNNPFSGIWPEIASDVSVAMLAFWVVLALGQRWHAEPHWRDRLGRALGGAWIVYLFFDSVLWPLWLQF